MTKPELIERLISKYPDLPSADVALVVNTIFEHMSSALQNSERIEIRGFGGFSVRRMSARQGRNPKTGETVHVPPRRAIYFKPGLEMRKRVKDSKHHITDV